MSSPRNVGGSTREGTRVVLKEITATLHNSPPTHPLRRKSINENPTSKTTDHEVKVRFAREFADIGSATSSVPESLSSASSFHSLTSTLSTKSSSGISADTAPDPSDVANISYVNPDIPGVDDLILACAGINLENERSFNALQISQDLSQDQTFASAIDETSFHTNDYSLTHLPDISDETQVINTNSQLHETTYVSSNQTHTFELINNTIQNPQLVTSPAEEHLPQADELLEKTDNIVSELEIDGDTNSVIENLLQINNVDDNQLNFTTVLSSNNSIHNVSTESEEQAVQNSHSIDAVSLKNPEFSPNELSIPSISPVARNVIFLNLSFDTSSSLENINNKAQKDSLSESGSESPKLLSSLDDNSKFLVSSSTVLNNSTSQLAESSKVTKEQELSQLDDCIITNQTEDSTQILDETPVIKLKLKILSPIQSETIVEDLEIRDSAISNATQIIPSKEHVIAICNEIEQCNPETVIIEEEKDIVETVLSASVIEEKDTYIGEDLDRTVTLKEADINLAPTSDEEQYSEFKPQRQSTTLSSIQEELNVEKLKCSSEEITNDLLNSSSNQEELDQFVSSTSEIFQDPSSFDFLLARNHPRHTDRLRTESLYVKFDPLVSNISMLPQTNTQSINEEQNDEKKTPLPNVGTPKRNAAIAAIDRLLFYSPIPSGTMQKLEEIQEKIHPVEEPKPDVSLITDVNMTKELELVRATVLQLEEELEKQKKEHEAELEKQKAVFQEKINKIQTQITQQVKSKTEMAIVVGEYEKTISRVLKEKENDRENFEQEKENDRENFEQEKKRLQEELQAANHHLTNSEASFNDVHRKYERVKEAVSAYKINETVLKESIQENLDTIKTLETRYDQLKNHAMTQLGNANLELEAIRKQNEAETVKLHAMIRKAELKSNSLNELVEQKTKENKELAKILDEVIARVGRGNQDEIRNNEASRLSRD